MNDLNQVVIEGKLVKDPEFKIIKTGEKSVCKFDLAVNKRYKDKKTGEWVEEVSYFLVETWQMLAEICYKYLKKGRGVRVIGELKQYRWTDPSNANAKRERIYIIGNYVEFQSAKKGKIDVSHDDQITDKDTIDTLDKVAVEDIPSSVEEEIMK